MLIYADPPYLMETRGGAQYRHEMTNQDHEELLDALMKHRGAVILSGYASELYDAALAGWHRIERKARTQRAEKRTEILWLNYEPQDLTGGSECLITL